MSSLFLQITGISGEVSTLISWAILFILKSPPPAFTTFLCGFMWTTASPLQLQMLMLHSDMTSLSNLGESVE